jgi:hypothetical protein
MTAVTSTIVERAAGLLAPRFSRRGFFSRSAVVGSAVVANPLTYALKPTSAYAAVCSCAGYNCDCGSMCCGGYTEFCCTIYGDNKCPPGSILGGWWKVDGTGFCGGPRYYMDCHSDCGGCGCGAGGVCSGACSGTPCGCANGDCNNRKAGCTQFRYGQCNQHLACIGPIICRVATCVPPWAMNSTCTTTTRVDYNTASHDRACLHRVKGTLESAQVVGNSVQLSGWAIDFDVPDPISVYVRVDGQAVGEVVANRHRPDIAAAYPGWGAAHGYQLTVPIAPGAPREVCVYGRNVNYGSDALLGCRTVQNRGPFGNVEVVQGGSDQVRVAGWAIDPDTTGPIDVHIYIDGVGRRNVRADRPRPDVAAAYPAFGQHHGFDVTITGVTAGARRVCVYAINVGAGANVELGCRTTTVYGVGGFSDVPFDSRFATEIGWAVDNDIVAGYADRTFRPTTSVSRQAMAAFLYRLNQLVGGPTAGGAPGFTDVGATHRFATEIGWLVANGIAEGFDDGSFRPTAPVSRQAMAAFLQRYSALVGGPGGGGTPGFTDVSPTHPFAAEIAWLAANGIAEGYPGGTFRPGAPVSRQAAAAFLFRLHGLL